MTDADNNASLRTRPWPRFLSGPDARLLDDLYIPALSCALRYDRCCAYFSSQVLAVAARGFGPLIANLHALGDDAPRPAVRLLVNEQLDREDVEALLATGDESALIKRLLRQFRDPKTALEKRRLQMLGWLARAGLLEVRVGVMRHTEGILHAKFGLIHDRAGDTLAFSGSDNETGQALTQNYEELQVAVGWQDAEFVRYYRDRFERLWNDEDAYVKTVPLPDAVAAKLIQYAPEQPPVAEPRPDVEVLRAAMLWRYLAAAPYLDDGDLALDATMLVDLWPHQRRVVEDVAKAFPAGRLLCDEVGMGKTVEAIAVLRRLLAGRGVKRALLLVPAGLLRQWQDELREKGGLEVPRWEDGYLSQPDGTRKPVAAADALAKNDVLLVSREWARLAMNRALVLGAPVWDLVLMDEAHAARRRSPEEKEFNSGNLLLDLLRELQFRRRARGILLLSATPMQTQPWEPWDLLSVLGIGGAWMVEFDDIRRYYDAAHALQKASSGMAQAQHLATLVAADNEFIPPPLPWPATSAAALAGRLAACPGGNRAEVAKWLRRGAPLGRRMHRNTRRTLELYHSMGLSPYQPPQRNVADEVFEYRDPLERDCYDAIKDYIERRFAELEQQKKGKGFVMTIYRRRAASSPYAFRRSLERRLEAVEAVISQRAVAPLFAVPEEQVDTRDLSDAGFEDNVDYALPHEARAAQQERQDIHSLLSNLASLGATDSKFAHFWDVLRRVTADGRAVLVFTEYADTMRYLRNQLRPSYGSTLGCYSGDGGEVWKDGEWHKVTKADITELLNAGQLKVLVCTDAASEGLNLQAASALINYDLPWNPSKVEQRIGRIDRIGQSQALLPIRNLFLADSVDMKVYKALRDRCGLFTHFVGPMQPVLSKAADILRGGLRLASVEAVLSVLDAAASEAKADVTAEATYEAADAMPLPVSAPPVTRETLMAALEALRFDGSPVRIRQEKKGAAWHVLGLGKKTTAAVSREALEDDTDLAPLALGGPLVQDIADKLPGLSATPLVVAEWRSGPYRSSQVRWVNEDGSSAPVTDAGRLFTLVGSWEGAAVTTEARRKAEESARAASRARVEAMEREAQARVSAGTRRQLAAARLRLTRELGRNLRCHGSGDLKGILQAQLTREAPDGRYGKALSLLRDYPQWGPAEVKDINAYVAELTAAAVRGRLQFGEELTAAINDPRWRAAEPQR